jgi:hypothetical protein
MRKKERREGLIHIDHVVPDKLGASNRSEVLSHRSQSTTLASSSGRLITRPKIQTPQIIVDPRETILRNGIVIGRRPRLRQLFEETSDERYHSAPTSIAPSSTYSHPRGPGRLIVRPKIQTPEIIVDPREAVIRDRRVIGHHSHLPQPHKEISERRYPSEPTSIAPSNTHSRPRSPSPSRPYTPESIASSRTTYYDVPAPASIAPSDIPSRPSYFSSRSTSYTSSNYPKPKPTPTGPSIVINNHVIVNRRHRRHRD